MRADRLLSIIMLLQARGRLTAAELATELEVSERTIYRDIDALSGAGVPVYAERGAAGGFALLDSYRTTLTGLTEHEIRALFMLNIPAPLAELGVSQELKTALYKLAAALPATRRDDRAQVRQRVHLDSTPWHYAADATPQLQTIHQAIWQNRKIYLKYHLIFDTEVERLVTPYGIVAKSSIWYLVYAREDDVRVLQVSRVLNARVAPKTFERPPNFDLVSFWDEWCAEYKTNRPSYPVTVRVAPELVPLLPHYFGERMHEEITRAAPPDDDGWVTVTLPFENLPAARDRILGFGSAIEVLAPQALRQSVLDFAAQIVTFYKQ